MLSQTGTISVLAFVVLLCENHGRERLGNKAMLLMIKTNQPTEEMDQW